MPNVVIGLAGNPNCGKTTVFNALTGGHQRVGNWPGVTVERWEGRYQQGDTTFTIVDLPGVYALDVTADSASLDEQIARTYLLSGDANLLVNVVDASNLERNLYLTTQLLEMRLPLVVALNMMDVAQERGVRIDTAMLARRLGCPVIPLVASKQQGIEALQTAITHIAMERTKPTTLVQYQPVIEDAINALTSTFQGMLTYTSSIDSRWAAINALSDDAFAAKLAGEARALSSLLDTHRRRIQDVTGDDVDIALADSRYSFINGVARDAVADKAQAERTRSDLIDRVVLHRLFGIPIFLLLMYLMFTFTINIGGAFIDFFDKLGGTLFVEGTSALLDALGSPAWLRTLLANGIGGGLQIVATFIPILSCLFLSLAVLEDSGYMARAAFVMDRFMRVVGLPGKSFVPMLIGFGCNVPAIMATRTLENSRDRLMTIMMNPFMSCGARLPVYALFAAAFFPSGGQTIVLVLYLVGIGMAVLTGIILKHTLLQGEVSTFVMELPPYHLPTLKGVVFRSWDRLKMFLFRAGRVIVLIVVVLSFLNAIGTDGSFGHHNSEKSVLSAFSRTISPAFAPMGLREENWPALVGIVTGIFAKEAVVGTLDALYTELAAADAGEKPDASAPFNLWNGIKDALESIPDNLSKVTEKLFDPFGLSIGNGDPNAIAAEQQVALGTFGAIVQRFDGRVGAFAYLLFVLLYFPCAAATAAIHRETNFGWTLFAATWTTGWAYVVAVLFYQLATLTRHPISSGLWVLGLTVICAAVFALLRVIGRRSKSVGSGGTAADESHAVPMTGA